MDTDTFLKNISVSTSDNFKEKHKQHILHKFRKDIYEFLISRTSEEDYMDLTLHKDREFCIEIIGDELSRSGWKWKLSFGDTGLFIFKENIPKMCW